MTSKMMELCLLTAALRLSLTSSKRAKFVYQMEFSTETFTYGSIVLRSGQVIIREELFNKHGYVK